MKILTKKEIEALIVAHLKRLQELTDVAPEGWYKEYGLESARSETRMGPSRFERWLRKKVQQYESGNRTQAPQPRKRSKKKR